MSINTTRFLASIHEGKFIYQDEEGLKKRIAKLEGKEVWVSLVSKTKGRSDNQNRYYWGVVIKLIADFTGYFDHEVHDTLKSIFLWDYTQKMPRVRSTSDLTTAEFEEYLLKCRQYADTELSIFIPLPNETPFEY
jgi:hypothetical protein